MQSNYHFKSLESDKIIYGGFFSRKALYAGDILKITMCLRTDKIYHYEYYFQLRSGEVVMEGKMTQNEIMEFAYRNQIPYSTVNRIFPDTMTGVREKLDLNPDETATETVTSREAVLRRIENALPLYRKFGQRIVEERFGPEYRFVVEENYSDTMWKLDLRLEKDGVRVELEGGMSYMGTGYLEWLDLAALTQYDPAGGVIVYSLYPELTDQEEWQDTIREALGDVRIKMR